MVLRKISEAGRTINAGVGVGWEARLMVGRYVLCTLAVSGVDNGRDRRGMGRGMGSRIRGREG